MSSFCPTEDATVGGIGSLKIRGNVEIRGTASLLPQKDAAPSLAQIYIYEKEDALTLRTFKDCHQNILQVIQDVLKNNPYAKIYKSLLEKYEESNNDNNVNISFLRLNGDDRRRYNLPIKGIAEVAAIISTGKEGDIPTNIDFRVYPRNDFNSTIIHKLSSHNEPMLFPLFFPFGTPGYSLDLKQNSKSDSKRITPSQYFGQRLSMNNKRFNPILHGGRLTQQYIIYGYIVVEWNRLNYIRMNQNIFRQETLQGLTDHIKNSSANTSNLIRLGNAVVLPSTYEGSPRSMQQLYQDSMAMTRELGRPDLFVTYTANPNWPEIKEYLQTMPKGTSTSDIAYFVVRAFNIRLSAFISEITSGKVFGPIIGYIYTIEFQKRGLPHAHCIFILNHENKLLTPDKIDRFISAEIPDKDEQPNLHEKVMKHMLHGPHSENTPCWNPEKSSCSKKFPFNFRNETDMTCDGFPKYKRNDNRHELNVYNKKINGKRVFVDNSMVVPYNPYLILKYDCHINVEYCGSLMAIKYMFKYLTKGHDRIKVSISGNDNNRNIDEISDYIDTRYLSSMEAAWRLQQIPMHGHSHSVMRLPVHLPGQQYVTFKEVNNIELETFREAAYAKGYGMNKEDVDEIMNEAVSVMMPSGLRSFFVYLLLTSENINGKRLWEKVKNYLYEDSNESNAISEIEQKLNG
nr:PREDICTED: uncharacterized protein LOC109041791 [Bemisia tabaci]